jgi:hypothetical protein
MSISLVQADIYRSGSGTVNGILPAPATVGNLVLMVVEVDAANLTSFAASSTGNVMTQVGTTLTINDGASRSLGIFACTVSTSTNTFTGTSVNTTRLQVQEFSSGAATPLVLDQFATGTGTGTAMSTANITPSQAVELVFGYGWNVNGGLTVGSGYTLTRAVGSFQLSEYQITGSTTPLNATATGTSATWGMLVASFDVGPAGGSNGNGTLKLLGVN